MPLYLGEREFELRVDHERKRRREVGLFDVRQNWLGLVGINQSEITVRFEAIRYILHLCLFEKKR